MCWWKPKNFVSKVFDSFSTFLKTKCLKITSYHTQMDGYPIGFNKTIIVRPEHYVADHNRYWDIYVQLLRYGYSAQVHGSTKLTPFSLLVSWYTLDPTTFDLWKALLTEPIANTSFHVLHPRLLHHVGTMRKDDEKLVRTAQKRYRGDQIKKFAMQQRRFKPYSTCKFITHHWKPLQQRKYCPRKLAHSKISEFSQA